MTKTTRPIVRIYNSTNNEVIDREMNDFEFADYEAMIAEELAKKTAEKTKAAEKVALLTKLGITDDEAKLLLS